MANSVLVWLRNDLRLRDNPALTQGLAQARHNNAELVLAFAITPAQWLEHDDAKAKLAFKAQVLQQLQAQAATAGVRLDYLLCPSFAQQPQTLLSYCQQRGISHVFYNREYPVNERRRDRACDNLLGQHGIHCQSFCADLLLDLELYNQQGFAYRSFAPWLKAWLARLQQEANNLSPLPLGLPQKSKTAAPKPELFCLGVHHYNTEQQALIDLFAHSENNSSAAHYRADLWPGDEDSALAKLADYCQNKIQHYSDTRDLPSLNGTSTLSPYLAAGVLSPRQCLAAIQIYQPGITLNESQWLIELGWREFYRYLSWHWPHISYGKNYKNGVNTHHHPKLSAAEIAWQQGQTGIPIIDAAMLQLRQTGWMHNRLRMLVANYYCHLIGGNWRLGEAFFMRHLIDGDFAANNGGWQWCASSGCDASPWPRIFNPYQQSKKFDPEGLFIKRFLPQLKSIEAKQLHKEQDFNRVCSDYYPPLIEYKAARQRALAYLKG